MKVAVVGAGISGLTAALLLADAHEVTLFESEPRLGGHANTATVTVDGRSIHVDTGFIVYNERNYPGLSRLFQRLKVTTTPTQMSFSVHDTATRFEFGGASIAGLVGSPANLLSPRWWSVVNGVRTLATTGRRAIKSLPSNATVADLRDSGALSDGLFNDYLLPMAAAIWSAPREQMLQFPARFLLRFFDNHGMLDLRQRPQWRTVVGGSRNYVQALRDALRATVRTGSPVRTISRSDTAVSLTLADGTPHSFDHAVLALHADDALSLLADPSPAERDTLAAMPFQANDATLHTDRSVLPRRRRCWAAWNYRTNSMLRETDQVAPVSVTYNLSILQHINTASPICVTLNAHNAIDPAKVLARYTYHHPLYTTAGEAARARWSEISGPRRTHFCGAYWFNGFHEDGVQSALRVARALGGSPL
ncbi:MAG: FAD-dependent oxidoreductase [Phycisphaerales bacterium]|nr:FAD-dependent oxidoreductase [Phycisphaerales bacterium]